MTVADVMKLRLSNEAKVSIEKIESIYSITMKPYYFPEYTMHGLDHVKKVLSYALELLSSESFALLDDKSVEVFVLATYIHDLGMFISEDGFRSLLRTQSWEMRFEAFIGELRNYSGKELNRIYGEIINDENMMDELKSRRINMFSKSNRYTVGEFIRIYHHELAYHIAMNGFPQNERPLEIMKMDDYAKIVGYIAMGHRGKLREIMTMLIDDGFTNKYQEYKPRKIPIALLMGLLWVADEIDDKNEYRAPINHEHHQRLCNTFSQQQWADNRCVYEPTFNYDLELIYVDANPKNTNQFLRIDNYCKKIQFSLDSVWMSLPEFKCNKYKLTVHKVWSKLYESKSFSFLPVDASLRINPEVIKYFVNPLYDNKPLYGVRELLANAIDACREREALDGTYVGNAKIYCTIDELERKFVITDNGIGMTSDTLVNYFMKVGASYKESADWKQTFADRKGKSKVARIGRFGIGVLAAFLLGDEIEVTTRHWLDTTGKGYRFVARIDGDIPDVELVECDYGTTISVSISGNNTLSLTDLFAEHGIDGIYTHYDDYMGNKPYYVPHYPFEYPQCFYNVKMENSRKKFNASDVYYYSMQKHITEIDYGSFIITIGSRKDMFVCESINDSISRKIVDIDETINYRHCRENISFAKINYLYYNGMEVKLPRIYDNDEQHFISDRICNSLYVNIEDKSNSSSLNLKKDALLMCDAYEQVMKWHAFFIIMYPLTLEFDSYSYLFKRHISGEDTIYDNIISGNEKSKNFAYRISGSGYSSFDREQKYIDEAITEWLIVSSGYEQNYSIPYDMQERKRKFKKAFDELEKYIF